MSWIISSLLLLIGITIGIGHLIAEPESILEYCERTAISQWHLDGCIYTETRWRDDPPPLSE